MTRLDGLTEEQRLQVLLYSFKEGCSDEAVANIHLDINTALQGKRTIDIAVAVAMIMARLAVDSTELLKTTDMLAAIHACALEMVPLVQKQLQRQREENAPEEVS